MDQEGQSSHIAYLLHKLRYISTIVENMHQADYAGTQMSHAASVQGQSIIKRRIETHKDIPKVLVQVKSSSSAESDGELERPDTQRRAVLQGVLSHLSTDLIHELMDMLEG